MRIPAARAPGILRAVTVLISTAGSTALPPETAVMEAAAPEAAVPDRRRSRHIRKQSP